MLRLLIAFAICSVVLALNDPSTEYANGISHFSSNLYQQCANSAANENVIISPFSISTALALLTQAANGKTFDQLKNGLHISSDKITLANQYSNHSKALQSGAGDAAFSIANQIYVQQGYEINKEFKEVAIEKFNSGVESVNFANQEATAQTINRFVEEKTNGKIKDIYQADSLSDDSRVVLINAIHFKGEWERKFYETETQKGSFYVSDTKTVLADFMSIDDLFNYSDVPNLNAKVLEMKYAKSKFSMIFLLPNDRFGLTELESKMSNFDNDALQSVLNQMTSQDVIVYIPKFTVEFKIKLNDVLKNLGISEMFTDHADLSGLLKTVEPVKVSEAVHKAFITVSEGGTEAAGLTGFRLVALSAKFSQKFRADHPFMYYIWDNHSKTVVFAGRITKFN